MSSHASTMASTITSMAFTVANMATTMSDLASSGTSVASTVATLATTIDNMATTIVSMSTSLDTMPAAVADIASTIGTIAATVAKIAVHEGIVDSRVTTMASTMAAMANTIISVSSTPLSTLDNDMLVASARVDFQAGKSDQAKNTNNFGLTQHTKTCPTTTTTTTHPVPSLMLPITYIGGTAGKTSPSVKTTHPTSLLNTTTSTARATASILLPITAHTAPNITTSAKGRDISGTSSDSTSFVKKTPCTNSCTLNTTGPNITGALLSEITATPVSLGSTAPPSSSCSSSVTSLTITSIRAPKIKTSVFAVTKPTATATAVPASGKSNSIECTAFTTTLNTSVACTASLTPATHSMLTTASIPASVTHPSTTNTIKPFSALSASLSTSLNSRSSTTRTPTHPTTVTSSNCASLNTHTSTSCITSTTNTTLTSINTHTSTKHTITTPSANKASSASLWCGVRTIKILDMPGRAVLYIIFLWGTPNKSLTEPLDQYMARLPHDSTANYRKMNSVQRRFNKTEMKHINRDPSCASFDISLLWKCIKLLSEGVVDFNDLCWHPPSVQSSGNASMESYISAIKKYRNDVYHGTLEITHSDFLQIAAELRHIFVSALNAAKKRYNKPDAEVDQQINKVHDDIDRITQEVLGEDDLMTFCGNRLSQDLIHEVNDVLKTQFQNEVNIDPIAFLAGVNLRLHVQKVFTKIKIKVGDRSKEGTVINYLDLLSVANDDRRSNAMPKMLLVEGVAGSGKTTLLTLITDEWLKFEQDRSFRGLDHYELLLKVQCRDRAITTLKSLLEKHVSTVFLKYRNFVLPLIKKCNVLVLIDGLDEANEDSERLLSDILEEMKGVPGCTLLCTSRPEKLSVLSSKINSKFHISYIELLGIPESSREQFVVRYHEEIKRQIDGDPNTDALVQKVRELGSRELFRLPINLVFFTWLYHHNPSAITMTTTHTQLYHMTHQLSVEKLLDRLTHHPITKRRDRRTLETCSRYCLEIVYLESLLSLIEDRLSLERKAEDRIRDVCISQGIPPLELLSAFFCLKTARSYLGMKEQYSVPHKGMQEYFAALHIVNHSSMEDNSGNIRRVLKSTLGTQEVELSLLQDVLQHVAGLLHLLKPNAPESVSVEVVDLLQESGVRCRKQWLDLLEDTEAAPAVLHRVAHHFMISSNGEEIVVSDSHVSSYVALLPHLPAQCPVRVNIIHNPDDLEELLRVLTRHSCMWLFLHNYYRNPRPQVAFDDILQLLLPRSNMKVFLGQMSADCICCLPKSLENLGVVLSTDNHCRLLLAALRTAHLPNLRHLKIHAPVNLLSLEAITSLPDIESAQLGEGVDLIMSGVDNSSVDKAARMIAAFQPPSGVRAITFPNTTATESGWRRLVHRLAQEGVKVRAGIAVPDTTVTIDQKNQLDHLAETTVGCDFWRITEDILWP